MAQVKFISKGNVDGQEYNKGNTLDVDEATKSRLLKEGCIEGVGDDCSELAKAKEEAQAAHANFDNLLNEISTAKTNADFKAIQAKYKKAE